MGKSALIGVGYGSRSVATIHFADSEEILSGAFDEQVGHSDTCRGIAGPPLAHLLIEDLRWSYPTA